MEVEYKQNQENRCDNLIKHGGKQTNNDVQSSAPSDTKEINELNDDNPDKEEDMNAIGTQGGAAHNNGREKSDVSDTESDTDRCHSATQARRARLLNSPTNNNNPTVSRDSKLRVSVFDHRIIPKKLISERISANRARDKDDSGDSECDNKRQTCVNSSDSENGKRKGSSLSYSVMRTRPKRAHNSDIIKGSETDLKMKRNSTFRTQFDVLLRSLIGDVNDMQVESSPNTISSGYESDSVQTHEAEIDEIFNKNKETKKEIKKEPEEKLTDYFSMSETYPNSCEVSPSGITKAFSSLPVFPVSAPEMDTHTSRKVKEALSMRSLKTDNDSNGFNYAQRHNYKLTKVTRSMYEIIHDLQSGEKGTIDGRKRSRKARRIQDGHSISDGNYSAKENRPRGRLQSDALHSDNKGPSINRNHGNKELNKSSVSGSVVRCVRRPLASESSLRVVPRKLSHTDSHNKLSANGANDNADKVQNELRNLLCDTSDVLLPVSDNTDHLHNFSGLQSSNNTHGGFTSDMNNHMNNGSARPNVSIYRGDDNSTFRERKPTLNEQFMHRPRPDDHVYETIPGDEKLYEEWKKMRRNTKVPCIRRFTTVPDLPGTFVPKEPPALPERGYLNGNGNQCKSNSSYIFMSDVNINIPTKSSSDTGYASVSTDQMLTTRHFHYPHHYPFPVETSTHNDGRYDETSDGYCSIDNLSLLQEHFAITTSPPEVHAHNWNTSDASNFNQSTQSRGDYFLHPVLSRTANTHRPSHGAEFRSRDMGLFEYRKLDGNDSDSTLVATAFDGSEHVKQIVQGTYV